MADYTESRNEEILQSIIDGTQYVADGHTQSRIEKLLLELKAVIEGGGGGSALPDVTEDDNGDVLTVVDGAWNKAVLPVKNEVVVFGYNGSTKKLTSGNLGEIKAALSAGKIVILSNLENANYFYFSGRDGNANGTYHFQRTMLSGSALQISDAQLSGNDANNTLTITNKSIELS